MSLWNAALLLFLLTLPVGYLRASVRRLSPLWFAALLLPLLFVVAPGIYPAPGRTLTRLVALAAAFCLGQFVGGRVRNIIQGRGPGRFRH